MTQYVTGPVDETKPMELDDGRPVELAYIGSSNGCVPVLIGEYNPGRTGRRQACDERYGKHLPDRVWFYDPGTGVLGGGNIYDHCVLRNRLYPTTYAPFKRRRKLCL